MHLKTRFHGQMSDTFHAAVFVTLSGGFQDAYTYICRGQVFANAQTGNIVLLSAALLRGEWNRSTTVSAVSSVAAKIGSTLFFAPCIVTSPDRRLPPAAKSWLMSVPPSQNDVPHHPMESGGIRFLFRQYSTKMPGRKPYKCKRFKR